VVCKFNKKAYFFTLDAFISIDILATGFFLISSTITTVPSSSVVEHISDDVLDLLSTAKANEFEVSAKNPENTLLEVIGEFLKDEKFTDATDLIQQQIIDNKVIPENHDFSLLIEDRLLYPATQPDTSQTELLVTARRIIFGFYEDPVTSVITFWGPYEIEVQTWQVP